MKDFKNYLDATGEIGFVEKAVHTLSYVRGIPKAKPNELILKLCLGNLQVGFSEVLVIGDRLETDIKMAASVGINSALVLTGETQREHLERSVISPTLIWQDLEILYEFLKE